MYMTYLMPTLGKLLAENIILLNIFGSKAGAKMTPYKNFVGVMDIFLEYL